MNRRDFLRPKNLLRPAGQIIAAAEELRAADGVPPECKDAVVLRFARRAMATTFEVMLPYAMPGVQEAAEGMLDRVGALEAQLTVYRDDSEVSLLNQRAAQGAVVVEQGLFDLLALSQRLHRETEGAFDIAIGALIKAWGFYRRAGRVPTRGELDTLRGKVGMRHVHLDEMTRTVAYDTRGLEINLGSIGKGYALDVVGRQLRRDWNCQDALLHGGHSSVLAQGNEPGAADGWEVGLLDPADPGKRMGRLRLKDQALGTSAATYQNLEYEGRKLPHLLDPRTLWPAEGMLQASVVAPSAAVADALATAFFILGPEKAEAYCGANPQIGAVLVDGEHNVIVVGAARDAWIGSP